MNMKNNIKLNVPPFFTISTLIFASTILTSCKKDNEQEQILERETVGTKGIYLLNEGTMTSSGSISYYDVDKKTTVKDYYKQINGRELGKVANDLKVYGSKMYCVITGSKAGKDSFVDVMNVNTGKTIKRISFNSETEGFEPRNIVFYQNKAYVSRYDGKISRIDTSSLNIDAAELQLKNGAANAAGLEGLAVANGKLYVSGSDHYLYDNSLNDKIVVIDLATFTKTKEVTVNYNPQKIAVTATGDLLVTSSGNYSNILPALQKISTITDAVTATYNHNVGPLTISANQIYLITDWNTNIISFDATTGTAGSSFVKDGTAIATAYGITINPFDQSVVISDANNYGATGKAFVFDKDGKIKYSFETGANPQTAAFVYTYRYVYKTL